VNHRTARSIVFHSYKGGTGKTTIAANVGALLAKRGARVILLDLDVYAPSLHSYFGIEPEKWLNDYLLDTAEVNDVMIDLTSVVTKEISDGSAVNGGKLWVGFCNPGKEEVYKLEGGKQEKVQLLRKFIALREQLFSTFGADYIIIDTSPGIRYWSINALAVADVLYLTLKAGDLDVAGTKKMASDIYAALSRFGGKQYLLLNRVSGYCVPHTLLSIKGSTGSENSLHDHAGTAGHGDSAATLEQEYGNIVGQNQETKNELSKAVGIDVAIALPCFCDIQFSKKEFLTVLHDPHHPFSKMIEDLAQVSQGQGGN
jgi:chromosome partitioning protein